LEQLESGDMTTYFAQMPSPIGELLLMSDGEALTGLHMDVQRYPVSVRPDWRRDDARLKPVRAQLEAYFAGELRQFDLPLAGQGSPFQQRVWRELCRIPFAETWSYGELAGKLGDPRACRAVGLANGRNPIAIVVPCHRVIGANGSLTGYGGGIERKRWLLAHELRVDQGL
jgi:methylated-DNA-[protein]-cysteine S-methyltransferase